jgi:N-acetylmuramoyl-L-alanine amidase CwlD
LSSINRLRARAGSALLAALVVLGAALSAPVSAADAPNFWFAGTRLILAHTSNVNGELAVSIHDPGFLGFLSRLGATVAWQPGERYVVFTASDRHTIAFTLGDPSYRAGTGSARAPFAPFADAQDAYVPFSTVARALSVEPIPDGADVVLQPQLSMLDVRQDGPRTIVTLRGATPLHFKKTAETTERVTLAFSGVGSTLAATRQLLTASLSTVEIAASGNPRNPTTTVTFGGAALSIHAMYPAANPNEVTIAFAPQSISLAGTPIPNDWPSTAVAAAPPVSRPPPPPGAYAQPVPAFTPAPLPGQPGFGAPAPVQTQGPVTITGVDVAPNNEGAIVRVALNGPAAYEWHRLADGRWYVDFRDVSLASAPVDQQLNLNAVQSVRVRQIVFGPTPVVRLAFTLSGDRTIRIDPSDAGATITVDNTIDTALATSGAGQIGTALAAAPASDAWKFGSPAPPPPGSNPRLIVIDPGHGGSDTGAMHNGLVEKVITLDVSQRLRAILVSRGWIVKMTRDRDVDVVAPNDDAKTELQGRCDIANNAGARLFVSVHVNSFTSPSLNGTTTYYYKPNDQSFAAAIQHRLMGLLGTQDDGVKRENFYVVRHTTMPAVLVETAFLSNPDDAAKLKNPAFLQNIAQGIADGIGDYAGSPRNAVPPQASMSGE